jgi:ribosome-binding protein aMBF1 (putative translation factor)
VARAQHNRLVGEGAPAGPIGSDAAEARQRRRSRSLEYRRVDEQYAATRELAAQVVLFRTRRQLTQDQLAELMGTSAPQISRIESGRYMPSGTTLQRLAEIFEVPLHITFGDGREQIAAR